MHFWIDKRSQTCGFSGRHRVPSSITSGGFGRRGTGLCPSSARNYGHTQAHIKLMVTPVHRFQSVECVAANAARHHLRPHATHHPPPTTRQPAAHHAPTPSSYNGGQPTSVPALAPAPAPAHSVELDSGVFLDLPLDGGSHRGTSGAPSSAVTPDPASSHHHHHQSHQNHHQHHVLPAAGKLKCGMWASFAIVTVFMAGAKFYFNNQSTAMEVLIFCSLLVVVLFAGCTVSLCEAVTSAPPSAAAAAAIMEAAAQVQVQAQAHAHVAPLPDPESSTTHGSSEELSTAFGVGMGIRVPATIPPMIHTQPEPPPPPYHVAVLLPQNGDSHQLQNRRPQSHHQHQYIIVDDSPPPSYDKAVS